MVFLSALMPVTIVLAPFFYIVYIIITTPRKKLHINYHKALPVTCCCDMNRVALMFARMFPDALRKKLFVRGSMATPRALDVFETDQQDPYTITEIEKDKVWMVTYMVGVSPVFETTSKERKLLDDALKVCEDDAAKEQAENDWQRLVVSERFNRAYLQKSKEQ